jgi:hypothetical protein
MYSVTPEEIESYKTLLEIYTAPLSPLVIKHHQLLKSVTYADRTYKQSDCLGTWRSGSNRHDEFKEQFKQLITNSLDPVEVFLLTTVINNYEGDLHKAVPALGHPEFRQCELHKCFHGIHEFIHLTGVENINDKLVEMNYVGPLLNIRLCNVVEYSKPFQQHCPYTFLSLGEHSSYKELFNKIDRKDISALSIPEELHSSVLYLITIPDNIPAIKDIIQYSLSNRHYQRGEYLEIFMNDNLFSKANVTLLGFKPVMPAGGQTDRLCGIFHNETTLIKTLRSK